MKPPPPALRPDSGGRFEADEEVFTQPMLSGFRAKIDFMRGIIYERTAAEWYGSVTTEGQRGG